MCLWKQRERKWFIWGWVNPHPPCWFGGKEQIHVDNKSNWIIFLFHISANGISSCWSEEPTVATAWVTNSNVSGFLSLSCSVYCFRLFLLHACLHMCSVSLVPCSFTLFKNQVSNIGRIVSAQWLFLKVWCLLRFRVLIYWLIWLSYN